MYHFIYLCKSFTAIVNFSIDKYKKENTLNFQISLIILLNKPIYLNKIQAIFEKRAVNMKKIANDE
jgi:hypothetical protein